MLFCGADAALKVFYRYHVHMLHLLDARLRRFRRGAGEVLTSPTRVRCIAVLYHLTLSSTRVDVPSGSTL